MTARQTGVSLSLIGLLSACGAAPQSEPGEPLSASVDTQRMDTDALPAQPDVSSSAPDSSEPQEDVEAAQRDASTSADSAGLVDGGAADDDVALPDAQGPSGAEDAEATDVMPRDDALDMESSDGHLEASDADVEADLEDGEAQPDVGPDAQVDPEVINLIVNPGFEEGEAPWNIWGGAARAQGDAKSGQWAVQATSQNGAEQLIVNLEPDTTYRLSGWGKVNGPDALSLGVKDYGGEQVLVQFTTPDYTEGSVEFTTGFGNTTAVVFAYKHTGQEPGWADDIVLIYVGPSGNVPVFSDEFEGEGPPDETKWTYETGFVRNQELQWYQPQNAFMEDGLLVIEGREEVFPNPNYIEGSTDWKTAREMVTHTSASLTTQGLYSFQYGHLVVRAKVSNLTGTWPAIWTLGEACDWPSNGEVDVMENYGGDILANFAWGTQTPWQPTWDASHWPVAEFDPDWAERFHIWELDWTAERMVIRLDGVVLNEVALAGTINGSAACEGQNPFMQPHRLLLNLALGGAGGSVEDLSFPTRYLIDYVRIYP